MYKLFDVFSNRAIWAAIIAWLIAGVFKVLFLYIETGVANYKRVVGSGGMPSSHTAFVCALAMSLGYTYGFASGYFSVSFCLAVIVMYDAAGIRRAAGQQAAAINDIVDIMINDGARVTKAQLKELLGHSPLEVAAGMMLGMIVGIYIG